MPHPRFSNFKIVKYHKPPWYQIGVGLWAWPISVHFNWDGDMDLLVNSVHVSSFGNIKESEEKSFSGTMDQFRKNIGRPYYQSQIVDWNKKEVKDLRVGAEEEHFII